MRITTAHDAVPAGQEPSDDVLVEREKGQGYPYIFAILIYLIAPYFIGTFLDSGTATLVTLVILGVGSLVLGLLDGIVFKPSLGFAVACLVMQYIAGWIYYNEGAWLHSIAVLILVQIGGALSKLFTRGRDRNSSLPPADVEG